MNKKYFVILLFIVLLFNTKVSIAIETSWKEFWDNRNKITVKKDYPYLDYFKKASKDYNVPLPLLVAVARGESNFNPKAISNKSCYGIMQIKWPGTANDLGINKKSDLFNPEINIQAGADYLSQLLKKFDNVYLAVAGYNYGPNAISISNVPEGAKNYTKYIYKHLQKVTSISFKETNKILLFEFTYYKSALNFSKYLQLRLKNISTDIFKSSKYTYDVYLIYQTNEKRNTHLQLLRNNLGLKIKGGSL